MGLSELMRMIITFVTFCLNKKKSYKKKKKQWFSIRCNFAPQGTIGNVSRHFGLSQLCVCVCVCVCVCMCVQLMSGRWRAEMLLNNAQDSAPLPDYSAPNVNSAEVESPSCKGRS